MFYTIYDHLEYLPFSAFDLDDYLEYISSNDNNPTLENLDESNVTDYAAKHSMNKNTPQLKMECFYLFPFLHHYYRKNDYR